MNFFDKVLNFLRETKIEVKRVNWPRRDEVLKYTGMVILISLAVAAYLGTLDLIIQFILRKFVL